MTHDEKIHTSAAALIVAAAEEAGLLRKVAEALCCFSQRVLPPEKEAAGLKHALATELVDVCTPNNSDAELALYMQPASSTA
jgi:hypothetical protein